MFYCKSGDNDSKFEGCVHRTLVIFWAVNWWSINQWTLRFWTHLKGILLANRWNKGGVRSPKLLQSSWRKFLSLADFDLYSLFLLLWVTFTEVQTLDFVAFDHIWKVFWKPNDDTRVGCVQNSYCNSTRRIVLSQLFRKFYWDFKIHFFYCCGARSQKFKPLLIVLYDFNDASKWKIPYNLITCTSWPLNLRLPVTVWHPNRHNFPFTAPPPVWGTSTCSKF